MRHRDGDLVERVLGGLVDDRVHHRDDGLGALEREALLTDVLGLQERLERLGGVEAAQDVLLLGDRRLDVVRLDPLLQPLLLLGLEDVGVLDTDVAAVRVAQHRQHVAQLHLRAAVEATDIELAIEIPQRQVVGRDIEIGMRPELVAHELQRIGVGHEVAAAAVGGDELEHTGVLVDETFRHVLAPADRLVGDVQGVEDAVVEVVADEQLVDLLQELTRLRALDHAVVVGGGERQQLADADLGEPRVGRTLELGRVLHAPRR